MKKLITILVLVVLALCLRVQLEPVYAVPRSFDNGVRFLSMTSTLAGTTDQLFTITGGRIEIISFFGECTVDAGSPGNTLIQLDATAGGDYDREYSTTVNIDTLGVGDVIRFSNNIDKGVLDLTNNVGAGQPLSWFVSPGELELNTASGTTGAIVWYMSYRRLERSSRVSVSEN